MRFGGEVPATREELETLPGVGRKTANVVLNNAYGVAVIAVDTHLFRVSNRIPLALGATPLDVELGLERVIPDTATSATPTIGSSCMAATCARRGRHLCGACLVTQTSAAGRISG